MCLKEALVAINICTRSMALWHMLKPLNQKAVIATVSFIVELLILKGFNKY
jgi:hypothetical protein